MSIVNLTPHEIVVSVGASVQRKFPASGKVARVQMESEVMGTIDGIPWSRTKYGSIEGLPEPEDSTYYLVSRMVKDRCPDRNDVIVPGQLIRDPDGKILGCKGFSL